MTTSHKHAPCDKCGGRTRSKGRSRNKKASGQRLECVSCGRIRTALDADHPQGHTLKRLSTNRDGEGNLISQWYITTQEEESREEKLLDLLSKVQSSTPKRTVKSRTPASARSDDYLSAYILGDPHINMMAWGKETGGPDWDLKIAERTLIKATEWLVSVGSPSKEAVIVNLGDFWHAQSDEARTPRSGHTLDVDTRWAKAMQAGLNLMYRLVEIALGKHDHITVYNVIGNHDTDVAYMLSLGMDAYFRNEPRVTVCTQPGKFHYHRFGTNLIGLTHGDTKLKPIDLESIMLSRRDPETDLPHPDLEGVRWRYWWCGHVHHSSVKDTRGCTVETFRALTPPDPWHASHGYKNHRREMTNIVLDKEHGESHRFVINDYTIRAMLKREAAK